VKEDNQSGGPSAYGSYADPLDFSERDLMGRAVIELRRAGGFMRGNKESFGGLGR
jgi:hypothetical protein